MHTGGSTACVLSLDTNSGMLYTANIGDSGYIILRGGQIIEESQKQTHYFNCPFQLSNPPPGFNTKQVDRYFGVRKLHYVTHFTSCIRQSRKG